MSHRAKSRVLTYFEGQRFEPVMGQDDFFLDGNYRVLCLWARASRFLFLRLLIAPLLGSGNDGPTSFLADSTKRSKENP